MNDRTRHGELSLALDVVTLVGELSATQEFYAKALDPSMTDRAGAIDVDMHGTGRFQLAPTSPGAAGPGAETETSQFPGYTRSRSQWKCKRCWMPPAALEPKC